NVISNNRADGIAISGAGATSNLVLGNLIGTDAAGIFALGNSGNGVSIVVAPGNTIGGTTPGARNVISDNRTNGIAISGAGATSNLVQGNLIGTDAAGTSALGNSGNG